jgi:hypothetical protein
VLCCECSSGRSARRHSCWAPSPLYWSSEIPQVAHCVGHGLGRGEHRPYCFAAALPASDCTGYSIACCSASVSDSLDVCGDGDERGAGLPDVRERALKHRQLQVAVRAPGAAVPASGDQSTSVRGCPTMDNHELCLTRRQLVVGFIAVYRRRNRALA